MPIDLIHILLAGMFVVLWAFIAHIAVTSRRSRQDEQPAPLPRSGNIWQR